MPGSTKVVYERNRARLIVQPTRVTVVSGPDKGKSCEIADARVRVGTASDNQLVLTDTSVSRNHLELQVQDLGYLVRDLDSTNGTYYREARIREVLLAPGAKLRIGVQTIIRLDPGKPRTSEAGVQALFGELVGTSPAMAKLYGLLAAVASTDVTVLLQGETGTGKEMVAEEIHRQSPRSPRLFNVLDCGSLAKGLVESEIFGHEQGAFTGASGQRIGVFERTRGGTVFLDEIGDMPLDLQTRLLRVLDRRTIKRVGGNVEIKVDVRLIAATNRDLAADVREGRFRRDLYHRLAVVRAVLPPLRKRRQDIPLLARHFLLQAGIADPDRVLTPELLEILASRRWPGNVRELKNVIERATVVSGQKLELTPDTAGSLALPEPSNPPERAVGHEASPRSELLGPVSRRMLALPFRELSDKLNAELEEIYFIHLTERFGQNISAMARAAKLGRHQIRRILQRYGLY